MGNAQSPPPSDPRYASASRAFTQKELEDLRTLFKSLAVQSQSNGDYVSLSVFQSYFGLDDLLGERMFYLVTQQRGDEKLAFEDLVIAKAAYEKGTKDEIDEFIFRLLDVSGNNILGRYSDAHLQPLVLNLLNTSPIVQWHTLCPRLIVSIWLLIYNLLLLTLYGKVIPVTSTLI